MSSARSPLALGLAAALSVAACGDRPLATHEAITVVSGYALPVIGGGQSAFVALRNDGDLADTVVRFASPIAATVTLHRTEVAEGTARMVAVPRLVLEPGQTAAMASGGLHLMLSGVSRQLAPGDTLPLELTLARAGQVVVPVPVVSFGHPR